MKKFSLIRSKESIGFWFGVVGFGLILLSTELGWLSFSYRGVEHAPKVGKMLAVTWLMATWWMSEAIPIAATSLLPMVLLPLLGILPSKLVARQYINEIIMLFLGGFMLALAIQRWELHKRISLHIVARLGRRPTQMVLGFMLASALLSMWISNTATTMMLLPIVLSVAQLYEQEDHAKGRRLGLLLMLAVAYSASIGGIATLVGTPPNLAFLRIYKINFPNAPELTFLQWLQIGVPISAVLLPTFWFLMTRVLFRDAVEGSDDAAQQEVRQMLQTRLKQLGAMSRAERWVLVVFALTALLWITRSDIKLSQTTRISGWVSLLGLTYEHKQIKYIKLKNTVSPGGQPHYRRQVKHTRKPLLGDGAVAIMMALVLFLLPAGPKEGTEKNASHNHHPMRLLDWETAKQLPWGMLLLFGGGFALASGIKHSGMSTWLGEFFLWKGLASAGPLLIIFLEVLLITFITEFTSNTATTQITLGVVAPVAAVFGGTGVHPYLLMIPITIAASCAFMMPVATPPNAIAYSSGYVPMSTMVRTGVLLNLVSTLIVTLVLYGIFSLMGLPLMQRPEWLQIVR